MKILLDVNLSPVWIGFITSAGFETTHWNAVGSSLAPDSEILSYAAEHGFLILTQDYDFGTLMAVHGHVRPSICQIHAKRVSPIALGEEVLVVLRKMEALPIPSFAVVTARKTRLVPLPLKKN